MHILTFCRRTTGRRGLTDRTQWNHSISRAPRPSESSISISRVLQTAEPGPTAADQGRGAKGRPGEPGALTPAGLHRPAALHKHGGKRLRQFGREKRLLKDGAGVIVGRYFAGG